MAIGLFMLLGTTMEREACDACVPRRAWRSMEQKHYIRLQHASSTSGMLPGGAQLSGCLVGRAYWSAVHAHCHQRHYFCQFHLLPTALGTGRVLWQRQWSGFFSLCLISKFTLPQCLAKLDEAHTTLR